MRIYGIMVIYNRFLSENRAFEQLINSGITLIVCDNSTSETNNGQTAAQNGAVYLPMHGNQGLSKAYNRALVYILEVLQPQDDDRVCFFDDDTLIPADYFDRIREQNEDILLPIVKDGKGIMSPVQLGNKIVTRFKNKQAALCANRTCLSGINSGMAVRLKIFRDFRYNEEMFLDYIDHMFIMEMRERKIYPYVLNVELYQRFSAVEDDKETARIRFKMQKKDLRIFYGTARGKYWYVVLKKHIKLAVKYRDLGMLIR